MKPVPLVTVVIPCHNLGQYLEEAVASVQAQTCSDWEIVVVDDGSTDPETRARLDAAHWPGTRILREPHRGLAAARNRGIQEARGEFLCALDADDRLRPTFLERTLAALANDPELTFAGCWLRAFGREEWDWVQTRCDLETLLAEDTVLTAALVRTRSVREAGGYDGAMAEQGYEDWDLWLTLVERGARGVIVPEVLFDYRQRADSMSAVCCAEPAHSKLMADLHRKHHDSYRRHLDSVLLRKDRDINRVLRDNDAIERALGERLMPLRALKQAEVARLAAKVTALRDRDRVRDAERALIFRLDAGRNHALEQVEALRSSLSFRITAPLRRLYDLFLRRPSSGATPDSPDGDRPGRR